MGPDGSAAAAGAHRSATRALGKFDNIPEAVREELAQDAIVRTLFTAGVDDPPRYAAQVARNLAVDWLRRSAELLDVDIAEVLESHPWQRRVEACLEIVRVEAAIARAPTTHRETLTLLYIEGRTVDEVVDGRVRHAPGSDRGQERDALYKRRKRALCWLRSAIPLAA